MGNLRIGCSAERIATTAVTHFALMRPDGWTADRLPMHFNDHRKPTPRFRHQDAVVGFAVRVSRNLPAHCAERVQPGAASPGTARTIADYDPLP